MDGPRPSSGARRPPFCALHPGMDRATGRDRVLTLARRDVGLLRGTQLERLPRGCGGALFQN